MCSIFSFIILLHLFLILLRIKERISNSELIIFFIVQIIILFTFRILICISLPRSTSCNYFTFFFFIIVIIIFFFLLFFHFEFFMHCYLRTVNFFYFPLCEPSSERIFLRFQFLIAVLSSSASATYDIAYPIH